MRGTAILILIAMGTSVLVEGRTHDAGTSVKICLLRNVDDRDLNVSWAQNITSQILAGAGVYVKWQLGTPRRREEPPSIIIDLSSNTPEKLAPNALAYAQVYEGVHIRVFWDRVRNAVRDTNPTDTFLLAHVMAHEITHVLEGVDRHSKTGLMKCSWTKEEIEEMAVRPLSLASEDVQLVRQGLCKRQPTGQLRLIAARE